MEWRDLVIDGYGRVLEIIEPALKGLTRADLDKLPKPDCNSMGWIAWHLTRGQDAQIADLAGEEQVWVRDKWYTKFKRDAEPEDTVGRATRAGGSRGGRVVIGRSAAYCGGELVWIQRDERARGIGGGAGGSGGAGGAAARSH